MSTTPQPPDFSALTEALVPDLVQAGVHPDVARMSVRNALVVLATGSATVAAGMGITAKSLAAAFAAEPTETLDACLDCLRAMPSSLRSRRVENAFGTENAQAVMTLVSLRRRS